VKVITDINQHTNVIGDGINVAQRIMSFGVPGQLLVSRSCYDMMRLLNSRYDMVHELSSNRQGGSCKRRCSRTKALLY
jgi:class 3 adenylate cyclase